jgi:hypothetical protein
MIKDKKEMTCDGAYGSCVGICTGGPGVFLGHPYPYPGKPVPGRSGAGNYGHGHGDHSGSRVAEGISGYGFSSHVFRFMIKNNVRHVFLILAM